MFIERVRAFIMSLSNIVLSNSHLVRNWMRGRQMRRPWHRFPLNMAMMLPDSIRCGVRRTIQQPDKTMKGYPP